MHCIIFFSPVYIDLANSSELENEGHDRPMRELDLVQGFRQESTIRDRQCGKRHFK